METCKVGLLGLLIFLLSLVNMGAMAFAEETAESAAAPTAAEGDTAASIAESEAQQNSVFSLGEVEVMSTIDNSGNPTADRIYSKEMREFNADTVADTAKLFPGVTLDRIGARNETMIRIRGFDQKQVPIYLDGVPIYVPYDGYPDLGRFTTYDLSEVVVSKGFTSVLYGPNTLGGAVNLVSRRPVEKFEANAGVQGRLEGYSLYANVGTNQGWWYAQGSASLLDTTGFFLPSSFKPTATEDGGERNNSYTSDSKFSIKVGLTPNETDEYSLTYINQHGEKGTPPYTGSDKTYTVRYWRWPYWNKQSLYFNSKTAFGQENDYYVKTRLYYDVFENCLNSYDNATYSTQLKKSSFNSNYADHTVGGTVEMGTYALENHAIRLAFHYKGDFHTEHNEGDPRQHFHEDIYSVGLEDTFDVTDKLYFIAGVSYDYVKTIKAEDVDANGNIISFKKGDTSGINPQLGIFYRIGEGGLAHASVAMKSRMPSIKDKFSYKMGRAIPNPDLDPERSVNYELGYRHQLNENSQVEVNLFYYDITDFIQSVTLSDGLWQNQNLADVDQYGFEVALSGQIIGDLSGGANYMHLEYENHTNDIEITNTPKDKLFAFLKYEFVPGFWLMVDGEYNSRRYSSTDRARVAGEYFLFGSKLQCALTDHVSFNVGVKNMFDQEYEIDEGYPEPGIQFYGGMDLTF